MLYFLIGDNFLEKRKTLGELVADRQVHIVDGIFDAVGCEQILSGDLFGNTPVLVLRGVWNADVRAWLKQAQKNYSDQTIIVMENSLTKKETDVLVKNGAQRIDMLLEKAATSDGGKGIFDIAHAFAARKRKDAWLAYHRELRAGSAAEQIHGILVWKMRDMLEKNPRDQHVISCMMDRLVKDYHDARRSGPVLELALEHMMLSL